MASKASKQPVRRSNLASAAGGALVLTTAPNLKTARHLARSALKARLVACANLITAAESHYWWRGKIESATEILLVLKTRRSNLVRLESLISAEHPYETPEFLVLSPRAGSKKYLGWLAKNC